MNDNNQGERIQEQHQTVNDFRAHSWIGKCCGCRICTLFEAHDDLEDGPIQLIDEFYFTLVTVAKGRKVPLFGEALKDHQRQRAAKAAKKAAREERHAAG